MNLQELVNLTYLESRRSTCLENTDPYYFPTFKCAEITFCKSRVKLIKCRHTTTLSKTKTQRLADNTCSLSIPKRFSLKSQTIFTVAGIVHSIYSSTLSSPLILSLVTSHLFKMHTARIPLRQSTTSILIQTHLFPISKSF